MVRATVAVFLGSGRVNPSRSREFFLNISFFAASSARPCLQITRYDGIDLFPVDEDMSVIDHLSCLTDGAPKPSRWSDLSTAFQRLPQNTRQSSGLSRFLE